jgi:hypothetical protein
VDNKDKKKNESPLGETKISRREAIKRIAKGVALVGTFAATTAFFQDECDPPAPYYNYSRSYRKYYNYYNYSKYNRSYYNIYRRSYYNYSKYNKYIRSPYYNYLRYYHFIFDV